MELPNSAQPMTRAAAREIDRRAASDFSISTLILMENAGRGCVETMLRLGVAGPVAICCYKGNNGGDGLVIARHLDGLGILARVILFCLPEDFTGDAAANWQIVARSKLPVDIVAGSADEVTRRLPGLLSGADWIVDAMLGTGAIGEPRAPFDTAIDWMNSQACKKLAVDVPSGLDCDTGQPAVHTVRADHTCTFAAMKIGFTQPSAKAFTGTVHVCDIGVPANL